MNPERLVAILHLEGVLPALAALAPFDPILRQAASGTTDWNLQLTIAGCPRSCALSFASDGTIWHQHGPSASTTPGPLRLWFPSPNQFLRAVNNHSSMALPLSGWSQLAQIRRFKAAGQRLEQLLKTPAEPALFAHGNLAVGLAAACAWLRVTSGERLRSVTFAEGVITFDCPALPAPHWIDLTEKTSGLGQPPKPPIAEVVFADLDTLIAELNHSLDSLAALAGGELRIRGHLLMAERLGLVLNEVSHLLKPA